MKMHVTRDQSSCEFVFHVDGAPVFRVGDALSPRELADAVAAQMGDVLDAYAVPLAVAVPAPLPAPPETKPGLTP